MKTGIKLYGTRKLLNRIAQLEEVLRSIASLDMPVHTDPNYWIHMVSHEKCAETLAMDTQLARIVLENQ